MQSIHNPEEHGPDALAQPHSVCGDGSYISSSMIPCDSKSVTSCLSAAKMCLKINRNRLSKCGTHGNQELRGISTCNAKITPAGKSELHPQHRKEMPKLHTHEHTFIHRKGNTAPATLSSFFQPFSQTSGTKSSRVALWSPWVAGGGKNKGLNLYVHRGSLQHSPQPVLRAQVVNVRR